MTRVLSSFATVLVAFAATAAIAQLTPQARKFYPDDPLWQDDDTLDTPQQPGEIELSDLYDRFGHIFHDFGSDAWGEAENVNSLDEVADSTWFTNRHGRSRLTLEELARGPDTGAGPDPNEIWTIFRGKAEGLTPGFSIVDNKGDRYVIKFGAPRYPALNSAAEVIATKILYAIGYNVPENYIVRMKAENLRVKEGTTVVDRFGDRIAFTLATLRHSLKRMTREPDGTFRVVASRYIPGRPLGPFRYYGRRTDDPNDLYDHEQRRELRGLRLISAWINHDDTRAQNTQDTWVEDQGRRYIKHYLIDFGSCFGSGTSGLQLPNLGFHYWMDGELIKKNALGFGFHVPKYRKVKWPDYRRFPSVGRFESEHFDPEEWKNDYPNPAFARMTRRDAFWAARLIMRFSPEELAAIVNTGQLTYPEESVYLVKTLIDRQRKCGDFGLNRLNPLGEFRLTPAGLEFTNLSEEYGLGDSGSSYRAQWGVFDNLSGSYRDIAVAMSSEPVLPLPTIDLPDAGEPYLTVSIRSQNPNHPDWNRVVRVYLRPDPGGGYQIVGIERES